MAVFSCFFPICCTATQSSGKVHVPSKTAAQQSPPSPVSVCVEVAIKISLQQAVEYSSPTKAWTATDMDQYILSSDTAGVKAHACTQYEQRVKACLSHLARALVGDATLLQTPRESTDNQDFP